MPLVALTLLACANRPAPPHTLTVLAASSLTEAFEDIAQDFEAAHPGVEVALSFAGSQALATQIRQGLRADVFASADPEHVRALREEGLLGPAQAFAENALVLARPRGRGGEADLAHLPELGTLVLGGAQVPVGRYTDALLEAGERRHGAAWREAVEAQVVSREPNVRLVLTKLSLGEADAAIVYATDARVADGVEALPLPEAPRAVYVQAPLAESRSQALAEAWLAQVRSPEGQAALAARGFGAGGP
ncbi:MAG: molybdate ABC transporter substrate-binding protein [Alphaproteobacteria bacterium]|nr:molybdate ABC transporter substrate-binding protein [Alphaproteobacteria bacterium]